MRRLALAFALLLSACATAPRQTAPLSSPAIPAQPQQQRGLIGMTPSDLMHRFGAPAMQIREGTSLKLQFRTRSCVLDAYLYPSGSGTGLYRVSHIDTRAPSGIDYSQAACVTALESRS
jgi:hypothetical protein